jgi:hypothetical protein
MTNYNSKDGALSVNQNYSVKISVDPRTGRGGVEIKGRPVQKGSRVDQEKPQKGER